MDHIGQRAEIGLLALLVGLFPFQFHFHTSYFTVNASLADPVVGLVMVLALIRANPLRKFNTLDMALGLFLAVATIVVPIRLLTGAQYFVPIDGFIGLIKQAMSIAYFFAVSVLVAKQPRSGLRVIVLIMSVVGGALAAITVGNYFFFGVQGEPVTFFNRNLYATYLVLTTFLSLSWFQRDSGSGRNDVRREAWFAIVVVLCIGATVLTASRAAFGGLIAGLILVIDWDSLFHRTHQKYLVGLVSAIMTPIMLFLFQMYGNIYLFRRFRSAFQGGSLGYRLQTWPESLAAIGQFPLLGIGLGQHPNYLSRHVTPHNTFILMVSGTGIIGLLVCLWFTVGLLRRAYDIRSRQSQHPLGLFVGVFVAFLIVALFHDINNWRSFWIATGLLSGFYAGSEARLRAPDDWRTG